MFILKNCYLSSFYQMQNYNILTGTQNITKKMMRILHNLIFSIAQNPHRRDYLLNAVYIFRVCLFLNFRFGLKVSVIQ